MFVLTLISVDMNEMITHLSLGGLINVLSNIYPKGDLFFASREHLEKLLQECLDDESIDEIELIIELQGE